MMKNPDAALIVGGGAIQLPVVREVQALGLKAVVTDKNPACACVGVADAFFPISTMDVEGHRALARELMPRYMLRGILTAGADVAPTVAAAAEAAGTPGIPYEVARRTHDKLEVRRTLRRARLDQWQPDWYYQPDRGGDDPFYVDGIAQFMRLHKGAVVVKPTEERASRGVSIVHTTAEIESALKKALPFLNMRRELLLEECLTGTEHSAEILLRDGKVLYFNMVDRLFRYDGGIPMETGHVNPSRVDLDAHIATREMLEQAAQALGVTWGPFKADVMWTVNGPKILECTARLSGGFDSTHTTPMGQGRHPVRLLAKLACGIRFAREDFDDAGLLYAACAAAFPPPGRVVDVPLVWTGKHAPDYFIITVKPDDVIELYQHCAQRPAFVIAVANDYARAWALASEGAETVARAIVTEVA